MLESLHVLHVSDVLPPHVGGIETALTTLFRSLPDIQFTVLTAQEEVDAKDFGRHVRVKTLPLGPLLDRLAASVPLPSVRDYRHLLVFPFHEMTRRRVAAHDSPDVVHLHSYAIFRHYAGLLTKHPTWPIGPLLDWLRAFGRYGDCVLFTDHSLFGGPHELFMTVRNDLLVERLSHVVCVEKSGLENVRQLADAKGLRVHASWIPNPVDLGCFTPSPLPRATRVTVGYAGRYEKEGIGDVVRLIDSAPNWVDFRLALGVSPEDQIAGAETFRGAPRAHVVWNLPYSEMPAFYRSVHVLLNPFGFGAPRTSCDGLASGRPVVRLGGSRVSRDLPLAVSPVFDPEPTSFFRSLADLRDSGEMERMAGAARLFAEQTFSATQIAEEYRRVYAEVARASTADR